MRRAAPGVPDGGRPDAGHPPEDFLRAPEAAAPEDGPLVAGRDLAGDHRRIEDAVLVRDREPLLRATLQGLLRGGDAELVTVEQHGRSFGFCVSPRSTSAAPGCFPLSSRTARQVQATRGHSRLSGASVRLATLVR